VRSEEERVAGSGRVAGRLGPRKKEKGTESRRLAER